MASASETRIRGDPLRPGLCGLVANSAVARRSSWHERERRCPVPEIGRPLPMAPERYDVRMALPEEPARLVSSQRIFEGRILTLDVDHIEEPDGLRSIREIIRHPGSVAVLPVHSDGSISLVRQFRHPARRRVWEICAGLLEPGETPEAGARRELEEETGLTDGLLEPLCSFHVSPGYSEEFIHLFRATGQSSGLQKPDGDERIEVQTFSLEDARTMAADGRIHDAKTLLAVVLEAERRLREEVP